MAWNDEYVIDQRTAADMGAEPGKVLEFKVYELTAKKSGRTYRTFKIYKTKTYIDKLTGKEKTFEAFEPMVSEIPEVIKILQHIYSSHAPVRGRQDIDRTEYPAEDQLDSDVPF